MTTEEKKKRLPKRPKFIGIYVFGGLIDSIEPYQTIEEGVKKMNETFKKLRFDHEIDDARIFDLTSKNKEVYSYDPEEPDAEAAPAETNPPEQRILRKAEDKGFWLVSQEDIDKGENGQLYKGDIKTVKNQLTEEGWEFVTRSQLAAEKAYILSPADITSIRLRRKGAVTHAGI